MKRLIALLTLLPCLFGTASAQKTARMTFDTHTHDFGDIKEIDGDVSCTFTFKNTGDLPLVINSVGVSCGCTTPQFNKEPLMPGKSADMKITFDPANRPGKFEKTINILCNDPRRNIRLLITGNVIPKPRTIQDDYPYHVADGLRIADRNLILGTLPHGKANVRTIGIANGGSAPVKVGIDATALPPYVTVKPRKTTLAPGERSEIEMTFNAPGNLWGKQHYSVPLLVNGTKQDDPLEITVIYTEAFGEQTRTGMQAIPRADYSSFFYHFSDQPQGKALTRQFQITNGGSGDLIIRHIGPSGSRIRAAADKTVIKAGDTATLTITLDTKGATGRLSEAITLVTNDPLSPAKDIRVLANIVK